MASSQRGALPRTRLVDALLHPHLVDPRAVPAGEQAHAVRGGHDLLEVLLQPRPREVLVDVLPHVEGRDDVEGDPGDDAQRAEPDHRAGEAVAVLLPAEDDDLAVGGDQFEPGHRGRQVAVAHP
ncbi:hypothetical protein ACFQX6_27315 [Streptosporangium lutulentum]